MNAFIGRVKKIDIKQGKILRKRSKITCMKVEIKDMKLFERNDDKQ